MKALKFFTIPSIGTSYDVGDEIKESSLSSELIKRLQHKGFVEKANKPAKKKTKK